MGSPGDEDSRYTRKYRPHGRKWVHVAVREWDTPLLATRVEASTMPDVDTIATPTIHHTL
jgi:hypothetical protein